MHATYATNVGHYDHILAAMSRTFDQVSLVRRTELTHEQFSKMERWGVPTKVLRIMRRRVRERSGVQHAARNLGLGDTALTAAVQLGRRLPPDLFKSATDYSSRRVAKLASDAAVLHFVEGLGHRALQRTEYQFSICERRAMHHAVFEGDFPAIADFPHRKFTDPIGDFLDYEYENSTRVMVYSHAAKKSFLTRGFNNEKIVVAPIGLPPQLIRQERPRDRYKLAFVGRGDVYKGLDLAVASVALLGLEYRLHVAGPMRPEVLDWLRRQPNVVYEGLLDKVQLRDLYSTAHLLVLPSIEAFGLAVAEAVHHGLHAVCAEETGIAEYLPMGSYTQVPGRDPSKWAEVIGELMDSETHLNTSNLGGEKTLRLVSWESAARRVAEIYSGLL